MTSYTDQPNSEHYTNHDTNTELAPLELFKRRNDKQTEVIDLEKADDGKTLRAVLIRDNTYEVWVKNHATNTHATSLRPDDKISVEEFNSITVKHNAVDNAHLPRIRTVLDFVQSENTAVRQNGVTALAFIARDTPDACTHTVDVLHEILVTTSNETTRKYAVETLMHISRVAPKAVVPVAEALQDQFGADAYWTRVKAREAYDEISNVQTAAVGTPV